jgi:hypothetical protein
LKTPVEPVTQSLGYKLGIIVITVVMLFLFLVYLGMIVGVAGAVVYHVTQNLWLLATPGGLWGLVAFVFPMIVGPILLLFMIKPIVSKPVQRSPTRTLKRNQDPLLFLFVEKLCDAVGAPRPTSIMVNCDVNASASLHHGFWSLFSKEVSLTIGMPLMAGLSLRQFGGVLAHEFGHFSQSAGMRLTYLVRLISHWFTRVVYERDQWDRRVEQWGRISWVLNLMIQLSLKVTRGILWCLMMVGNAVSGMMLRQMEYDADQYETRYFGSNTFATTSRRIGLLSVAYERAIGDLGTFIEEDRLVDNFPQLVAHNMSNFTREQQAKICELLDSRSAHWFDTHPTDQQRINAAMRERTRGICRVHAPASILSTQFERLCHVVTKDFYQQALGDRFRSEMVHPFEHMAERQQSEQESFQALHRFLQGNYSFFGYREADLNIPDVTKVEAMIIRKKLMHLKKQVMNLAKPYGAVLNRLHETDDWLLETHQAEWLKRAEFSFAKDLFSKNLTTRQRISNQRDNITRQQATIRQTMQEFDRAVQTMIELAIQALGHPDIAGRIEDADDWIDELENLNATRQALYRRLGTVDDLRYKYASLNALMAQLDQDPSQVLVNTMLAIMKSMTEQIKSVHDAVSHVDYPFDHAQADMKLGMFLMADFPDPQSPGEVYAAADRLLDRFFRLQARILGRKCVMAERVLKAVNIEPLPEPKKEDQLSPTSGN